MNNPSLFKPRPAAKKPNTGDNLNFLNVGTITTTESKSKPTSTSTDFKTFVHSLSSRVAPDSTPSLVSFTNSFTNALGFSAACIITPVGNCSSSIPESSNPIASCARSTNIFTMDAGVWSPSKRGVGRYTSAKNRAFLVLMLFLLSRRRMLSGKLLLASSLSCEEESTNTVLTPYFARTPLNPSLVLVGGVATKRTSSPLLLVIISLCCSP